MKYEQAARADGAELITGIGEFRAGKAEYVTDWCKSADDAWRQYCTLASLSVPGIRHCSFDITAFDSAEAWQSICERMNLSYSGRGRNRCYVWTGPGIEVVTYNNPLTGEYNQPELRENDPGFASYIGASGDDEKVGEFYNLVCEVSDYIKAKDPTERSYC